MPVARATIGAANAGAGPALEGASFPLDAGAAAERRALDSCLEWARQRGLVGARLFGHVASAPWHASEAVHAGAGLVALGAASVGLEAGVWALIGVALSCGLRVLGVPGVERLLPRRPSWSLLLRPCRPGTRRLVVAATDRARVSPRLTAFTLGAQAVALLSLAGPAEVRMIAAMGLLLVGAVAGWLGRMSRPEPAGPEAYAARAVLRYAERPGEDTTAVALTGATSAQGEGILAVLDWWGLRREDVEIDLVVATRPVEPPPAVAALTRAGWRVRTLVPDDLRSPP